MRSSRRQFGDEQTRSNNGLVAQVDPLPQSPSRRFVYGACGTKRVNIAAGLARAQGEGKTGGDRAKKPGQRSPGGVVIL